MNRSLKLLAMVGVVATSSIAATVVGTARLSDDKAATAPTVKHGPTAQYVACDWNRKGTKTWWMKEATAGWFDTGKKQKSQYCP